MLEVSAQDELPLNIGKDITLTSFNINNFETISPVNHTSQGRPTTLEAHSEGGEIFASVMSEIFQEGLAESWVGVTFHVEKPLLTGNKRNAEIFVTVSYEMSVDISTSPSTPYEEGGGSVDAIVYVSFLDNQTEIDRIHFNHKNKNDRKIGKKTLKIESQLTAGNTYHITINAYAYGDVYEVGYAESYVKAVVEEIKINFLDRGQIFTRSTAIILSSAGISAVGIAVILSKYLGAGKLTSTNIAKKFEKTHRKIMEKEKAQEKKIKSRKGKGKLSLSIDSPLHIIGTEFHQAVVTVRNQGQESVDEISLRLQSNFQVTLEKGFEEIHTLRPGESQRIFFPFKVTENERKGNYTLRFTLESKQAPTQTKRRLFRAIKIAALTGGEKMRTSWFEEVFLEHIHHDVLLKADDILELLKYDLIIVFPELQILQSSINNLSNFAENGQSLFILGNIETPETETLSQMLGYERILYEQIKPEEGAIEIIDNEHPITNGCKIGEVIPIPDRTGKACISQIKTAKILGVQKISLEGEDVTIPGITVNEYGNGKIFHINLNYQGSAVELRKIIRNAFNWLLSINI
jgi:hypothetical protein